MRSTASVDLSDDDLVARSRAGDRDSFEELWRRHSRSAVRVARQLGSVADADRLVSDAYAAIHRRILAGGGPTAGFRPYLYSTIRGLAGAPDAPTEGDAPAALDRAVTARAYRSLPERWQTVLWYAEVEHLDPAEIATILGMTSDGAAALLHRAREGLRSAWLRAHASDASASADCRWAIHRLDRGLRGSLPEDDRMRLDAHVDRCARCTALAEQAADVGSRLAPAVVPLVVGVAASGAVISQLAAAAAIALEAVPAMPAAIAAVGESVAAGSVAGGSVAGGVVAAGAASTGAAAAGSSIAAPVLVGSLAAVALVGGSIALPPPAAVPQPHPTGIVTTPVREVAADDPAPAPRRVVTDDPAATTLPSDPPVSVVESSPPAVESGPIIAETEPVATDGSASGGSRGSSGSTGTGGSGSGSGRSGSSESGHSGSGGSGSGGSGSGGSGSTSNGGGRTSGSGNGKGSGSGRGSSGSGKGEGSSSGSGSGSGDDGGGHDDDGDDDGGGGDD